jgi:hypothetical protein
MMCFYIVNTRKIDTKVEFLTLRIKMTVHIDRFIRYSQFVATYMRICLVFHVNLRIMSIAL